MKDFSKTAISKQHLANSQQLIALNLLPIVPNKDRAEAIQELIDGQTLQIDCNSNPSLIDWLRP